MYKHVRLHFANVNEEVYENITAIHAISEQQQRYTRTAVRESLSRPIENAAEDKI